MRVKQTARKSTSSLNTDPVNRRMKKIVETKRQTFSTGNSYYNAQSSSSSIRSSDGGPSGKQIPTFMIKNENDGRVKVKPRAKPGDMALKEIKRLQKGFDLQIPRAVFHRVVREVSQGIAEENEMESSLKYQPAALEALQEAAEAYLVGLFEDSYLCTIHAKRVTLFTQDMELCRKLRRY